MDETTENRSICKPRSIGRTFEDDHEETEDFFETETTTAPPATTTTNTTHTGRYE